LLAAHALALELLGFLLEVLADFLAEIVVKPAAASEGCAIDAAGPVYNDS